MKSLLLNIIRDKQFKRFLKILKYISSASDWVTIKELATGIGASRKIVEYDINLLNEILKNKILIKRELRRGVKLEIHEDSSIDDAISLLVKDLPVFNILNYLFQTKTETLIEWEEVSHTSKSTVYKIINYLNKELKTFKISISSREVKMMGSEVDIRIFYYNFYSEIRDIFLIDSFGSENLVGDTQLIEILKSPAIKRLSISHRQLGLWLMISRTRQNTGNRVKLSNEIKEKISKEPEFLQFKEEIMKSENRIFNNYKKNLDEIEWFYITTLNTIIYDINAFPLELVRTNDIETLAMKREEFKTMINDISFSKYPNVEEIIDIHHACLINISKLSNMSPIYQKISNDLKQYIVSIHNDLYNYWKHKISENKIFFKEIQYTEDVAVTLAMISATHIFKMNTEKINIVFSIVGEAGYATFLAVHCETVLPKNANLVFLYNEIIDKKILKNLNADLLVTNYNDKISFEECNVHILSKNPSIPEWTNLRKKILEIKWNPELK